jgi:alpha-tubulin suppressor-like RCC1 family protein
MAFISGPDGGDLTDIYITDWWVVDQLVGSRVYGAGRNTSRQLAAGDAIDKSKFVQAGNLTGWMLVEAGTIHTSAIKTDGTLWGWGGNSDGQIGNGTIAMASIPVQVGLDANWKQISCGFENTTAIKTNGTMWAWGNMWWLNPTYGNFSSPIQVGAATDWKQIACGYTHFAAVKVDGTIWSCGYDDRYGSLGYDMTPFPSGFVSSPTQIGSLSDWKQLSAYNHVVAVKTDGTLWAWGNNSNGQLGDGTFDNKSSPVQIGTLSNWKQVVCGFDWTLAVKTDGTLWGWGDNYAGAIGDGSPPWTDTFSPVQIGSLNDWKQVSASQYHTNAVKIDGTLWSWGPQYNGELGTNDGEYYSSPVQVGSLNNWKQVSAGRYTTLATTF